MKPSSLYGHLAELIVAVDAFSGPADTLVRRFFRERHYIGSKERRWLAARIFGVIRHRRLLDAVTLPALRAGAEQRPVMALALAAAHALAIAGDSVDEIAAAVTERWIIDAAVPLPKEFLASVGIRLRELGDAPGSLPHLALVHSFPDDAVTEWVARIGAEETGRLLVALNAEAPLTIRVNTLRCTVHECAQRLRAEGIATEAGTISPFALRLPARCQLEALGSYREGWFEVQDEGSQLLSLLLRPDPGSRMIDACAGAGGKTMHLGALMQNKGALIAIDPEATKLKTLSERAARAGVKVTEIITARHDDPALDRLHSRGDGVLVDAPCSGLGTVRRNPWLKAARDPAADRARPAVQGEILRHAARMVRPGGRLVYSTCTLRQAENEHVVEAFLRDAEEFALASASEILRGWGIDHDNDGPYLMLWPHRTGTDGFFAAVMHRSAGR